MPDTSSPAPNYRINQCGDAECGADIIWTTTKARRRSQPVDAAPSPDGTILLTQTDGLTWSEVVNPAAPPLEGWPGPLRTPHHQTCPAAHRYRRAAPGKKTPHP